MSTEGLFVKKESDSDDQLLEVVAQERELEETRDTLTAKLGALREKQRVYHKTISSFKQVHPLSY